MPFIGQEPQIGAYHVLDSITASATATYNLQLNGGAFSPASANHLLVSLNGVLQKPGASFNVSGSQITFTSPLTSSDNIHFIMALGNVLDVGTPTDGSVTIAKIAGSGTRDSTTFLRGDGTFAEAGGGKVLQVVHTLYDTEESIVGQANTVKPTGLVGTITPTDATSNILITYGITFGTSSSGAAMSGQHHTVYHDMGQTGSFTALTNRFFGSRPGGNGTYMMLTAGGNLLHDHNTTSAINYKVYFHYTSNWDKTIYVNRGGSESVASGIDGQSYMTLMEIAT